MVYSVPKVLNLGVLQFLKPWLEFVDFGVEFWPLAPARELFRWLFQAHKDLRILYQFRSAAEVGPLLLIVGV